MQNKTELSKEKILSYLEYISSSNEIIINNMNEEKLIPNIENIFFKIIIGGNHANRTVPFEVTLEDTKNNLTNQISYHLNYNVNKLVKNKYNTDEIYKTSEIIGNKYINKAITTISLFSDEEGCEYGGMYNYKIIAIPTMEVFKILLDNHDFSILNSAYEEVNKKEQHNKISMPRKKLK